MFAVGKAGLFALALLFVPVAQDWAEQCRAQLDAIGAEIAADFEVASDDFVLGELEPGDSDGFDLELIGDAEYVIVGVCDADCSDLDLIIYDPDEDEVAADLEPDDYPVLHVDGEGTFWVEVLMADCQTETCLFGVQVFVRY